MKKKCKYSKCDVEFEDLTRNRNKEFCCNAHRLAAAREHSKHLGDLTTEQSTDSTTKKTDNNLRPSSQVQPPQGMDFHTQLSFDLLRKESERWETAYNKELAKREKLEDENKALEKQFSEFKKDKEIEAIRGEKPSGLGALSENSIIKEIVPHVAPHIGDIFGMLKDKMLGAKALGGLSPEDEAVVKWLAAQSPETQASIRALITSIAALNDEKTIQGLIANLIQVIQKGGVPGARPVFNSTGTFGR